MREVTEWDNNPRMMCVRQLIERLTMLCNEQGMAEHDGVVSFSYNGGADHSYLESVKVLNDKVYICGGLGAFGY